MIDGSKLQAGDILIGLPSSGVHSNGFSLVRKVFDLNQENVGKYVEELGMTLGEALLTPTKIYVKPMRQLMQAVEVKAVSHVTGGGFYENIPRMMNSGMTAKINLKAVPRLPIFDLIQKTGKIPEHDMYNTFNMGVGMVCAVAEKDAAKALETLKEAGQNAVAIGEVMQGEEGVVLC